MSCVFEGDDKLYNKDNSSVVPNLTGTRYILESWEIPAFTIPKIALHVKKVIVQPDKQIVIVIFLNGDKSIVKCGKDDVFSVETGVAIAISKYVLGSGSELKRVVKNATIQEVKKKEAPNDKIEVGDTVEIINALELPISSELGKYGIVKRAGFHTLDIQTQYTSTKGGFWVISPEYVKLIKKGG